MSEKDCFIMAQGAYMVSFDDVALSMSRTKDKAMPMERADADDLLKVIPMASIVMIDGSDVMHLPDIIESFDRFLDNPNDARLFEEKLSQIPREVEDEQEKIRQSVDIKNKLYHRMSFSPNLSDFWGRRGHNQKTAELLDVIATGYAMFSVCSIEH